MFLLIQRYNFLSALGTCQVSLSAPPNKIKINVEISLLIVAAQSDIWLICGGKVLSSSQSVNKHILCVHKSSWSPPPATLPALTMC